MKTKIIALLAITAAIAFSPPAVEAQSGPPSYTPAQIGLSQIWNANIGQFGATNAFTGSTNWPANTSPQIGVMKYQNIALEDDMIPPTNSAGSTNTYVFAPSVTGVGSGDLTKEITWVHAYTQSAGISPTNHVAVTNITIGAYGYLKLVSYAVTTGTNQSALWYAQKISSP